MTRSVGCVQADGCAIVDVCGGDVCGVCACRYVCVCGMCVRMRKLCKVDQMCRDEWMCVRACDECRLCGECVWAGRRMNDCGGIKICLGLFTVVYIM